MTFSIFKHDRKRSKGQINDLASLIVVPFALGFILVAVYLVFTEINDAWQDTDSYTQTSKNVLSDSKSKFVPVFDYGFLIIFLGMIFAGITGLFLLDTHPIIFTASIIGFLSLFIVSAFIANAFSDATESGTIGTLTNEFTFIPLLMENLLPTIIIVSAIFSIAFFAKIRTT